MDKPPFSLGITYAFPPLFGLVPRLLGPNFKRCAECVFERKIDL